jgi:transcriptional regulator with XRE-family HTH domain
MKSVTTEQAGSRIRVLRLQQNLTLAQLADSVGIGFSQLSKIEKGSRGLSLALATKLARQLGVSVADLTEEKPAPTPTPDAAA